MPNDEFWALLLPRACMSRSLIVVVDRQPQLALSSISELKSFPKTIVSEKMKKTIKKNIQAGFVSVTSACRDVVGCFAFVVELN
jgi:hypothetical protein